MNKISKFTIYGEQNSGVRFLLKLLNEMLYLDFIQEYGFKRQFIKDLKLNNTVNTPETNDDTLFIVIVMNAYDWVGAMHKKPYHLKRDKKTPIYNFITTQYVCHDKKTQNEHGTNYISHWSENKDSSHPYFIDNAKNLVEVRNLKFKQLDNLKNNVSHFYILRQEKLMEDINNMIKKYDLKCNLNNLPTYIKPLTCSLDSRTINFIKNNLSNNIDSKYY